MELFQETELSVLTMTISMLEGGDREHASLLIQALRLTPAQDLGEDADGISILAENMDVHTLEQLAELQGEPGEAMKPRMKPHDGRSKHDLLCIEAAHKYYILLKRLTEFDASVARDVEQWSDARVLGELGAAMAQIEVLRDGQLETIYFSVPATVVAQAQAPFVLRVKGDMEWELDRTNPQARIADLVNKSGQSTRSPES